MKSTLATRVSVRLDRFQWTPEYCQQFVCSDSQFRDGLIGVRAQVAVWSEKAAAEAAEEMRVFGDTKFTGAAVSRYKSIQEAIQ